MVARRAKTGKTRKKKGFGYPGVFALIFLGILVVLGYNNVRIQGKRGELERQRETLEERVEGLQAETDAAEAHSLEAGTAEYQERVLREQGLYKRVGEEVIIILPPEARLATPERPERVWWNPLTWF